MLKKKKITVHLDAKLLSNSQKISGEGITPTITRALEALVAKTAYEQVLALRGKVRSSIKLSELRED